MPAPSLPDWFWEEEPESPRVPLLEVEDDPQPDPRANRIAQLLATPEGRRILAESMIQPLRPPRDYTAVGRKMFLVEQLPPGALPIYGDPNVTASVVGEEGKDI